MDTVPQQILDALPEPVHATDVLGWAPVGAAPGTSLGETHLLVTRRRTFALCRPSPWETLKPLGLRQTDAPSVVTEGFETWLVLPLEGRGDARIPITGYDLKALEPVLALLPDIVDARRAAPPTPQPAVLTEAVATVGPADDSEATRTGVSSLAESSVAIEPPFKAVGATFDERVDLALETLRRVGMRAARRGDFNSLDVSARVDSVELSVHYDRAMLARLADEDAAE